tara:strand:- start:1904 stop:2320 length:417 start_codon:yes stop_codon:yes gene_type:complete
LKKKISDKDKKDWQDFITNKKKLHNKDLSLKNNENSNNITKFLDLHGLSLEQANNVVEKFINKCFENHVNKIVVITGKGLRSKNIQNPYVSKNLSILKNSIPNFIKSRPNLMKIIKLITEANIKDGGQGAFYIFLKKH